jgi:biofilm PGA synthesis N-glycosyltransferase PgaC
VKANMLGWQTRSFLDLKVSHYRFTGSADGAWKDCVKNGRANYVSGYHPIFMLVKCVKRLGARPYVIGSMGLLWGFVKSHFNRSPRVEDRVVTYIRAQQMRRLLLLDSIWK